MYAIRSYYGFCQDNAVIKPLIKGEPYKFKLDNGLDPLSADTYDIGINDLYALTKGDADLPLSYNFV